MDTYLENLKTKCNSYAQLYYRQAKYWRYCHFTGGFLTIFLSGLVTVFSETISPDNPSYKPLISSCSFMVTVIGGILTFSKPLQRVTINEKGGDKYSLLCDKIDIKLLKQEPIEEILDLAYAKWSKYIKEMDEPDLSEISPNICCCV